MNRTRIAIGMSTALGVAATLGVTAAPAAGAQPRGHQAKFTVIASHLSNPRGLARAPGGKLYLAETGSGGKVCVNGGPEGTLCLGRTGSLDVVGKGGVKRIVTGLISGSDAGGTGAEGLVSVSGRPDGSVYGLFGGNSHVVPPKGTIPDGLRKTALAQLGHLWLVKHGQVRNVSDVGDQDWTWTKHHIKLAPKDFPDANPNDVLYSRGQRYVADAGANTLVKVGPGGKANVVAFLGVPPNWESDAVATCVARGPDRALYVGELLGGFHGPGHARIWRIAPGHAPKVWAAGLTTVQGCGFGSDGAFYATEFQTGGLGASDPAGDVVRIGQHGVRTHLGTGKLFFPSGFAAGRGGSIYVSNCSIAPATGMGKQLCPDGGQVVRIG